MCWGCRRRGTSDPVCCRKTFQVLLDPSRDFGLEPPHASGPDWQRILPDYDQPAGGFWPVSFRCVLLKSLGQRTANKHKAGDQHAPDRPVSRVRHKRALCGILMALHGDRYLTFVHVACPSVRRAAFPRVGTHNGTTPQTEANTACNGNGAGGGNRTRVFSLEG